MMNNQNEDIIHPLFIPIHPLEDEWVKIDPHLSPFPIHLLYPAILASGPVSQMKVENPYYHKYQSKRY